MNSYRLRQSNTETELSEYSPLLQHLLFSRGITTKEDSERFLNPEFAHLYDPFLLMDMDKAVERILEAIKKEESILIYSDFDADGIPGGVILHNFFTKIGYSNFRNYIPHRRDEGYGFHKDAVSQFEKENIDLIITVDVGIADNEAVQLAQDSGIDVIITDHHEVVGSMPNAFAVVNPKRSDCTYPDAMLCGSGVAYKLVHALAQRGEYQERFGLELLDLVGLATLSDMVPLTNENRVLAYFGLRALRSSRRPGFIELFKKLKLQTKYLTEDDIGFLVTPRINAASRMGHPMDAFKLLIAQDEQEAHIYANHLDDINKERKSQVASIVRSLHKKVKDPDKKPVIVVGDPDWQPALLGLVANKVAEEFHKPVFLWGREGGEHLKGSCRSEGITDLISLMEETEEIFEQFGGHRLAGGFSINHANIHRLEEVLCQAQEKLSGESKLSVIDVDYELKLREVTKETAKEIDVLAPFGIGNPKPLFLFRSVEIIEVKNFGKGNEHLDIKISDGTSSVRAIAFFTKVDSFRIHLEKGLSVNVIAHIERSFFRGREELRLRLVDVLPLDVKI